MTNDADATLSDTPPARSAADQLLLEVLLSPHGPAGPYPAYRRLRQAAPVHVSASGVVVLSRYRDCDTALRDRALGKADESLGFRLSPVPPELSQRALHRFRRTMLFRNPPDHHRLRTLVADVFTTRHIRDLRSSVVTAVEALLDSIADKRDADIITDLALPLPVSVIGDLLGLPEHGRAAAAPMVRDLMAPLEPAADAAAIERAANAEDQLADYLGEIIADKRRRPGEDLLSRLATARGRDTLDHDECVGTAILLFAAGFETTTNLIGNGTTALLEHPDQAARLRSTPDLAANAVEELLRWDAPVQTNGRTALAATTIGDTVIEPGQVVLMLLGSANRDPDRYGNAEELDLARPNPTPLSFGGGIHYCLGAALARMEAAEALPRLLARFPNLAARGEPTRRTGLSFRGLTSLPVHAS
ncbi:cytochrome P450 [Amycolatopsis sp. K13G38]|uniref:Cytochrome P450 n=1 Tax=Amycolatopsis acididurans TaxID=2724524 RepID=A0ABX1JG82_9PSEU|nr:cytochrome P450 [Amycolatopsis acididurans]NKQ58754.1 cytochrome P450 [Amycolatopsis acididurans]